MGNRSGRRGRGADGWHRKITVSGTREMEKALKELGAADALDRFAQRVQAKS
jgi:hypothetical protein